MSAMTEEQVIALEAVPEPWRAEARRFVLTGAATPEFWAAFRADPGIRAALERWFRLDPIGELLTGGREGS